MYNVVNKCTQLFAYHQGQLYVITTKGKLYVITTKDKLYVITTNGKLYVITTKGKLLVRKKGKSGTNFGKK